MREDPFNKNRNELSPDNDFEMNKYYQGVTQYYGKIAQESNKILINWIFALNTGGLVILIPFIFKFSGCRLAISIFAALTYLLGIISIYFSILLERNKFNSLAENSEKKYKAYQNNKITGREYIESIQNPPKNQWPSYFENTAAVCWLIGIVTSMLLLIISKSLA
ncbi:TPA: hypothetical protein ACPYPK_001023 [Legionella pneumophila]|nr:hypothetical protein [Legionella pneumophila]HAU1997202.1 hypothetical protein [Legionella pneumophila]